MNEEELSARVERQQQDLDDLRARVERLEGPPPGDQLAISTQVFRVGQRERKRFRGEARTRAGGVRP